MLSLVDMANPIGSSASSLDPLEELDAEVRILRRRVRRQGHFLHQIDELGGHRLDQVDEEMGHIRSDLSAAMRAMEEKVMTSLDNLDIRLQSLENNWIKR